jgi:hypothetical protein
MTKTKKSSSKNEIKPMYNASKLTKNSSRNLWVVFPAGTSPKNDGLVYSSTLSRDKVRSLCARALNMNTQDIRSRRVSNLTTRKLTNQ